MRCNRRADLDFLGTRVSTPVSRFVFIAHRTQGMQYVKRKNGFSESYHAGHMGYRDLKYLMVFDVPAVSEGGVVKSPSFRYVGEVQMVLASALNVKLAMHIEYRIERGDLDVLPRHQIVAAQCKAVTEASAQRRAVRSLGESMPPGYGANMLAGRINSNQ